MKQTFITSKTWCGCLTLLAGLVLGTGSATPAAETAQEPEPPGPPYQMWSQPNIPKGTATPLRRMRKETMKPSKRLLGDYRPPEVECAYPMPSLSMPCLSVVGSRPTVVFLRGEYGEFDGLLNGRRKDRAIKPAPSDPAGLGYFQALCAQEAGESIEVEVTGVRSVLALRVHYPLQNHLIERWSGLDLSEVMRRDPYLLEDPLAYYNNEPRFKDEAPDLQALGWWAFETPLIGRIASAEFPYMVYHSVSGPEPADYPDGVPLRLRSLTHVGPGRFVVHLAEGVLEEDLRTKVTARHTVSRYGYFWRGLRFAYDRENRVAGRELVAVDLATAEVLARQRSFIQWDEQGNLIETCPKEASGELALINFLKRVFPGGPLASRIPPKAPF